MGLVKATGNMYSFVDWHWNPIKGKCKMGCSYCYVPHTRAKRFYQGEPYLSEKELKTNLRIGNFIFVGSMTDMWGDWIPDEWITKILQHCRKYNNKYLFQSKNPRRFSQCSLVFKSNKNMIWGTTIETNRNESIVSNASVISKRIIEIQGVARYHDIMISIEPIMDFDLREFMSLIIKGYPNPPISFTNPSFVVIGADSKKHNLLEPPPEKIQKLINELRKFTKVILKDNLKRLGDFK